MHTIPLSASAPALALVLLVVTPAPAAAFTEMVQDTWEAAPGSDDATAHAEAVTTACRDRPDASCADTASRIGAREGRDVTTPAREWFADFKRDPVAGLVTEAAHVADVVAVTVAGAFDLVGGTLERLGIGNPFGGGP